MRLVLLLLIFAVSAFSQFRYATNPETGRREIIGYRSIYDDGATVHFLNRNVAIDTTLSTDKTTPARHATKTTYYTKGGKVCALPSTADGGAESCTGGAGGGGGALEYGMTICAGGCYANETSTWKRPAPGNKTVTGCIMDAVTYPTGAALAVDVLKNGTTSIFATTVLTIADGGTAYNEQTSMSAAASLAKGDYLIAKVLTVGSTVAGDKVTVVCTVE
jgi:hypothetical protein